MAVARACSSSYEVRINPAIDGSWDRTSRHTSIPEPSGSLASKIATSGRSAGMRREASTAEPDSPTTSKSLTVSSSSRSPRRTISWSSRRNMRIVMWSPFGFWIPPRYRSGSRHHVFLARGRGSVRRWRPNNHDGARAAVDDVVADGAKNQAGETAQAPGANDHQTSVVGGAGNHRPRLPLRHITGHDKRPVP